MDDNTVRRICSAIIIQAIVDYQELVRRGLEWVASEEDWNFSITELEQFFAGKWCRELLGGIEIAIGGEEILCGLKA